MAYITLRQYLDRNPTVTQGDIAEQLGVSQATVSQYMSGKQVPSLGIALRMEQLYGVPCRAWANPQQLRDRRFNARRDGARRQKDRAEGQSDRRKGPR